MSVKFVFFVASNANRDYRAHLLAGCSNEVKPEETCCALLLHTYHHLHSPVMMKTSCHFNRLLPFFFIFLLLI